MSAFSVIGIGQTIKVLLGSLYLLRVPLFIVVVLIVAFVAPDQTREIYSAHAESWRSSLTQIVFAAACVFALCFVLWLCLHELSLNAVGGAGTMAVNASPRVLEAVSSVIAMSPLLAIAAGLLLSARHASVAQTFWCLVAGAIGAVLLAGAAAYAGRLLTHRHGRLQSVQLYSSAVLIAVTIGFICTVLAGLFWPTGLPRALGPVAIVGAFAGFFAYFACFASSVYHRFGYPLILMCIAVAGVCALGNDNRRARTLEAPSVEATLELVPSFLKWYTSRADRNYYIENKKPYPVYIIAAAGGGINAAYHAAMLLARVQDRCPNFAQHVFAISGVSGGSLGGGVFAGLARKHARNQPHMPCFRGSPPDNEFERSTEAYFEPDLISPILWSGLFSGITQVFIPVPLKEFDRAYAFEKALEELWSPTFASAQDNFFGRPFTRSWDPKSASPALLLNTTVVTLGNREIISPFPLYRTGSTRQAFWHLGTKIDLPVSSAISLSARFPWITPSAELVADNDSFELVDGGLNDNTGLTTVDYFVRELVASLTFVASSGSGSSSDAAKEESSFGFAVINQERKIYRLTPTDPNVRVPDFQIKVISIRRYAKRDRARKRPFKWVSDIVNPLQALYNVRSYHQEFESRQFYESFCPNCNEQTADQDDTFRSALMHGDRFQLPLGWVSSRRSKAYIKAQLGNIQDCVLTARRNPLAPPNCLHEFFRGEMQ